MANNQILLSLDIIKEWSQRNLDIIYFVYGAAFLAMGIIILVQPKTDTKYGLGRILPFLAYFGLFHALHEFLYMWTIIRGAGIFNALIRSIFLTISYLFLFEFGRRFYCIWRIGNPALICQAFISKWITSFIGFLVLSISLISPVYWEALRIWSRYLICLPGSILIGISFIRFYKSNKNDFEALKVTKYFYLASICFFSYGILAGLVTMKGDILLSKYLNIDTFMAFIHLPVEIFRAACAVGIATAIYGILEIFHWESVQNLRRVSDKLKLEFEEGKEKVRRIEELMAAKTHFVSTVSHELRTPLTAIKANIDLISGGRAGRLNDDQKTFLNIAGENVNRLTRLINDILGLQSLTSSKIQYEFKEIDINETIRDVGETMYPLIEEKNIKLNMNLDKRLPKISCDPDKIVQVLDNLIVNAFKFTDNGDITISSKKRDKFVEVSVEDTGCGIKSDDFHKLFEPFTKLKKKEGTGLGLVICREIVNAHGGGIWAESDLGKGSNFHFVLPIERNGHHER